MAVYFILEDNDDDWRMKIGRAMDHSARRRALQTGNSRNLLVVGWIASTSDAEEEARLHAKFAHRKIRDGDATAREWFWLQPADILPELRRAGQSGFVARDADAFEIIGYDKDAIPEYLGVWNWGDLEVEECCPFCGCMSGMHFQEASHMYHCVACDTLTDFSEGQPGPRQIQVTHGR